MRPAGRWRTSIQLSDGDHAYKFRLKSLSYFAPGQVMEVFDPYALHVTNDEQESSIARVKGGRRIWTEHVWKHDDVPLPQNQDLIIYELFVGDFAGGAERRGRFDDVIAKLDHLKDLGINCVELPKRGIFTCKCAVCRSDQRRPRIRWGERPCVQTANPAI